MHQALKSQNTQTERPVIEEEALAGCVRVK